MSPDPLDSGGRLWTGVRTSAENGYLELEPGSAELAAGHVEKMLGVVVGVQNWIDQNATLASPVIAESVSGRLLWTVFSTKFGTELRQRIDRHRTILVDMGNTFVLAGKRYAKTDDDSAHTFADLHFDSAGTPPTGTPPKGTIPTSPHKPDAVTTYDSYGFGPEQGAQLGWEALYTICGSMNPQAVADAGAVWHWLATTLDTGFTTLRTTISSVSDRWKGVGAQSAISATTTYTDSSKQLTGGMDLLGDTLIYISGWLQQTKQNAMPNTPSPPPGNSISQQMENELNLTRWQENFQSYYSNNYSVTTTRIVTLPAPDPVVSATVAGEPLEPGAVTPVAHQSVTGEEGSTHLPGGDDPGTGGEGGGDPTGVDPSGGGDGTGGDPSAPPGEDWQTKATQPSGGLDDALLSPLNEGSGDPSKQTSGGGAGILAGVVPPGGSPAGSPSGKGGIGGKSVVGRGPLALSTKLDPKLFPRAVVPAETKLAGRAGPAGGYQPGAPYGGTRGRSLSDEEREKKRSEYLNSSENLDEALGEPGRGVRPVLDR